MIEPRSAAFTDYERMAARSHHALNAINPDPRVRFPALRAFYADALDQLMAAPVGQWGIDVHEVRWSETFSPIERIVWQILRSERIVMYPQFPVANYFVDFGNPQVRVAIECDGKEFHLDKRRDAARDADLARRGWQTFRFTGEECFEEMAEDEEQEGASLIRRELRDIAARVFKAAGHSPRACAV